VWVFSLTGGIAVCTIMGDVWIVDGVDDTLEKLVWKRFASGLNQPLGMVVSDDQIHVIGRDQLTRLHDINQDGEADFYECLTNEFPTARGNSFALTLHQDDKGRFYWFTRSSQFGMTRFTPGSKPEANCHRSTWMQWHGSVYRWIDRLCHAPGG
jgi:hypothetical protein